MTFTPTKIPDVILIAPRLFEDARGFFYEGYRRDVFAANGIPAEFVQDNYSKSAKGTVRGLHYQVPPKTQAKLIQVLRGAVFDVAVDLRRGSPTFGQWVGCTLSSANHHLLSIPTGFAHGFCAVEDETLVMYKVSDVYSPAHERGVLWSDPALGIEWPALDVTYQLSDRDRRYPLLKDAVLA